MDPQRLLGMLIRGGLGGGRRSGRRRRRDRGGLTDLLGTRGTGALGLGALGVAVAAFEHFTGKAGEASGEPATGSSSRPAPMTPPAPAPPPPTSAPPPPTSAPPPPTSAPPPPPGAPTPAATATIPPPPPPGAPPPPATSPRVGDDAAKLLVQTMIAAANADGTIDAAERQTILSRVAEAGLGEDDAGWVRAQLDAPPAIGELLPRATSDQLQAQMYAVTLLAIDIDTDAERAYVADLRRRLALDDGVVASIEQSIHES